MAIDSSTKWKPGRDKLNEKEYGSCQMQDMIGNKDKKIAHEAAEILQRVSGSMATRELGSRSSRSRPTDY